MPFAHDTIAGLRAAVDLVNSGEEPDTLTTVAQVDAWYAEHGYTGRRDGDGAELAALRALRPVLRELLTAGRGRAAELGNRILPAGRRLPPADRDRAAELVNAMLADARAPPHPARHDGPAWPIPAVPGDATLDSRV